MEQRNKILIVDDVDINREILTSLLEEKYECIEAGEGATALKIIGENIQSLSLILLDLMMPDIDGFQILESLSRHNMRIPVIIITANSELDHEKRAFELGAVDFIPKPFDPDIILYRVDAQVKLKNYQDRLEAMVEAKVEDMAEKWAAMIQAMAEIIEYRNQESGQHVKRTSILTKMLIQQMNKNPKLGYYFSPHDARFVYESASLHDIGKISISDAILLKPGRLTDEEYRQMQKHTLIGYEMSEKFNTFTSDEYRKFCGQIILSHHEKWDGSGYPLRLSGEYIPLAARIVSVADTYDAITSRRPYHSGAPHEKAVEIINQMSGIQFDPYLVELFNQIEAEVKQVFNNMKESTQEGFNEKA